MRAHVGSWFAFVMFITLVSCTQGAASGRGATKSLSKQELSAQKIADAETLHEHGEIDGAISSLQTWIDNAPYEPAQDQAYELVVQWLLELNRHDEAKRIASFFLSHHQKSPSASRIIKLFDQATPPVAPLPEHKETEPVPLEEKSGGENPMDSVLDKVPSAAAVPPQNHKGDDKDYLFYDAPLIEVERVIAQRGRNVGLAHARMAKHYFHLGELDKSAEHMERATNLPDDIAAAMGALKQEIESIQTADLKSLGVLLPLTGSFAPFGKKTLAAMGLAWALPVESKQGITTLTKDGIRIVIADSKGDVRETVKVLDQLIKTHKVALVVGDITNDPSLLAAQRCQQYGVPMLSLSRHPAVAGLGEYIFVVNASPKQQIERLVDHAINKQGHRRFGILFARHNYGMAMSELFFNEVIKKGGTITALEAYDANDTSFAAPVKKLVGKYYLTLRPDAHACNSLASTEAAKCRNSIKPIVDFDALFIPEFQKLALVIPALLQEDMLITRNPRAKAALAAATKIENPAYIQLLGTNSWNDKAVLDKIAQHVDGAYFVDSFSFDETETLKQFVTAFQQANGSSPSSLEVFAHDAASLAIKLLSSSAVTTRSQLRERIANFKGPVGLLSGVAFLPSGELDAPESGFQIAQGVATYVPQTLPNS